MVVTTLGYQLDEGAVGDSILGAARFCNWVRRSWDEYRYRFAYRTP